MYKVKSKFNKVIGILGGMGPMAGVNILNKIFNLAQQKYNAVQDNEFPEIILYNLPLFGFDEKGVVDSELVDQQLKYGVTKLEQSGSDFIIIACNTVYYFYKEMQSAVDIPIINLIDVVSKKVLDKNYSKVGLLTSESTKRFSLYQNRLISNKVVVISTNDVQQNVVNNVILHVMAGKNSHQDTSKLMIIIKDMYDQGAQAIILGCTEIPLAISQHNSFIELFDANYILVEEALKIGF